MNGKIVKSANPEDPHFVSIGSLEGQSIVVDENYKYFIDDDVAVAFEGDIYKIYGYQNNDESKILQGIAEAYRTNGTECFASLNGSFAIVVLDKIKGRLLLVRDHIGLSSFYYSQSNDGTFYFSTDFAWMIQSMPHKTINTDALFQYMHHLYTLAPATIINEIAKLRPASILEWHENKVGLSKYWDIEKLYLEGRKNQITCFDEAKKELTELIKDAIKIRYKESQTGVMLSSGIDSSLVTAVASQDFKSDVSTLTIGVKDKRFNESIVAKNIADYLGVKNTTLYMDEDVMAQMVELIVDACPEPMGDCGIIPNLYLVKRAKENYNYVMGGDGGDEIFSGYPHYSVVDKAQKYDCLGGILSFVLPAALKNRLPCAIRRVVDNRNKYNKTQILLESEINELNRILKKPCDYKGDSLENPNIKSWRERRMVHDIQTSLVDEMIYKAVGCANFAGVKVLSPLLDYRVIELSCQIPLEFKYRKGITKYILRQIDYDYIPEQILDVPKRGFVLPINKLLRTTLSSSIRRYINRDYLDEQNLFSCDEILKIYNDYMEGADKYQRLVWLFYIFQLWYKKYIYQDKNS